MWCQAIRRSPSGVALTIGCKRNVKPELAEAKGKRLPKVGAMDDAIWRRLIVIPFGARISGESDIKNYSEFLIRNSGGYIVKWLIEGAKKAIDNNFRIINPKVVQEAIDKYRNDNDWMSHFLDDCCELGTGLEEKSGDVYLTYRSYCTRTGEFIRSTAEFYNALELRGIRRRRTKKCSILVGISLLGEERE